MNLMTSWDWRLQYYCNSLWSTIWMRQYIYILQTAIILLLLTEQMIQTSINKILSSFTKKNPFSSSTFWWWNQNPETLIVLLQGLLICVCKANSWNHSYRIINNPKYTLRDSMILPLWRMMIKGTVVSQEIWSKITLFYANICISLVSSILTCISSRKLHVFMNTIFHFHTECNNA